jgi:hypothetical protein
MQAVVENYLSFAHFRKIMLTIHIIAVSKFILDPSPCSHINQSKFSLKYSFEF